MAARAVLETDDLLLGSALSWGAGGCSACGARCQLGLHAALAPAFPRFVSTLGVACTRSSATFSRSRQSPARAHWVLTARAVSSPPAAAPSTAPICSQRSVTNRSPSLPPKVRAPPPPTAVVACSSVACACRTCSPPSPSAPSTSNRLPGAGGVCQPRGGGGPEGARRGAGEPGERCRCRPARGNRPAVDRASLLLTPPPPCLQSNPLQAAGFDPESISVFSTKNQAAKTGARDVSAAALASTSTPGPAWPTSGAQRPALAHVPLPARSLPQTPTSWTAPPRCPSSSRRAPLGPTAS